jgi:hypothetical protein
VRAGIWSRERQGTSEKTDQQKFDVYVKERQMYLVAMKEFGLSAALCLRYAGGNSF